MSNVLAIDVGYGHVKWVSTKSDGSTQRGMFPSVAAITSRDRSAESNGMFNLRTVTVNVGEHNYVVGRDAYLETDAHFSRSRLTDYCKTDGYKALMLGAMAISGMREIAQLVIGLPLTTMAQFHEDLKEQYRGEHLIGANTAKRKSNVFVENVTVTSQPAGAILHAATIDGSLRKKNSLVVDVGYFTVDYLMCQGMKPYYARSGAVEGGMGSYFDQLGGTVVEQLSKAGYGRKSGIDHFLLEKSLTEAVKDQNGNLKYELMVGNKTVDITESVEKSKVKLKGYIDRIVTGMGSSSLNVVNSIVLAGGGGSFIKEQLRKRIGNNYDYVDLSQGQFAIAQGYAALGITASKRMSVTA